MNHNKTPVFDSLKKHQSEKITPFHVPGHKHGNGLPELYEYLGKNTFEIDLNAMEDIDDICNPISSIKEAHELIADAFHADSAFMLTNGTTAGIHAMMLSNVSPGDKIILPRNAHKSTISGLIISGAIPVYVHAEYHHELGISTTSQVDNIENKFIQHPDAVASFTINPSYYGFAPDLKGIVEIAHKYNAVSLVDEAHGCHFGFHSNFPISAMQAGADMSASSTHKTCGSFTQSSILLMRNKRVSEDVVKQVLNLQRSTSGSYLLMSSIDVARKQLVLSGEELLEKTLILARMFREEINKVDGLYCFGCELKGEYNEVHGFDETKLTINVHGLGLTGYEVEHILRREHKIQVELSDMNNILAIFSIGDTKKSVQKLLDALKQTALKYKKARIPSIIDLPEMPEVAVIPRDAFYSKKRTLTLEQSVGEISGENIMAYPPGIPIISLGERITKESVNYIKLLKKQSCTLQGTADPFVDHVRVLDKN